MTGTEVVSGTLRQLERQEGAGGGTKTAGVGQTEVAGGGTRQTGGHWGSHGAGNVVGV